MFYCISLKIKLNLPAIIGLIICWLHFIRVRS